MTTSRFSTVSMLVLAALTSAGVGGCRTASDRLESDRTRSVPLDEVKAGAGARGRSDAAIAPELEAPAKPKEPLPDPRTLTFFGPGGETIAWGDFVSRAVGSDVVLIGETHGHELGLAFAAALWEDVLKGGATGTTWSSGGSRPAALSLEFFERDEQSAMDDYLAGLIDEAAFKKATERSEGNYPAGHRAMLELAKSARRPVIASNAPRRYVRLARTDGFGKLDTLTPEQQRLFTPPATMSEGRYRDEFMKMMGGMDGHGGNGQSANGKSANEVKAADGSAPAALTPEEEARLKAEAEAKAKAEAEALAKKEGFFRSQNLWDATMADSIVRGLGSGYRPIVHVVGQFHTDHNGGLTERVKALKPGAYVMTISVIDASSAALREEDKGRADVVVYVGK